MSGRVVQIAKSDRLGFPGSCFAAGYPNGFAGRP